MLGFLLWTVTASLEPLSFHLPPLPSVPWAMPALTPAWFFFNFRHVLIPFSIPMSMFEIWTLHPFFRSVLNHWNSFLALHLFCHLWEIYYSLFLTKKSFGDHEDIKFHVLVDYTLLRYGMSQISSTCQIPSSPQFPAFIINKIKCQKANTCQQERYSPHSADISWAHYCRDSVPIISTRCDLGPFSVPQWISWKLGVFSLSNHSTVWWSCIFRIPSDDAEEQLWIYKLQTGWKPVLVCASDHKKFVSACSHIPHSCSSLCEYCRKLFLSL